MKTAHEYMSLKKVNSETINSLIAKKEDYIKAHLENIFSDVLSAEIVGEELLSLARLKDARLLMFTSSYKAYEKAGKPTSYEKWLIETSE